MDGEEEEERDDVKRMNELISGEIKGAKKRRRRREDEHGKQTVRWRTKLANSWITNLFKMLANSKPKVSFSGIYSAISTFKCPKIKAQSTWQFLSAKISSKENFKLSKIP